MLDKSLFTRGLTGIADQLSQAVPPSKNDAYYLALGDDVTPEEWQTLTARGVRLFGWGPFLPTVPDLLAALRKLRGEPSVAALDHQISSEAGHAYERVMASGVYTPEGGTTWNYRRVVETCGRAAGEAFMAAGGPEVFRVTNEQWNHDKRRNAFVAAYQHAAREEPAARLLPAGKDEPKQIAAGAEPDPRLSVGEAKGFLEMLRPHLPPGELPEMPKADAFAVNCDPKRYAEIKAEAERMKLEDGAKAS